MSTDSKRRHFSAQEKVTILKRHLVERVPVADLCDELKLNPNAVYRTGKGDGSRFSGSGHRLGALMAKLASWDGRGGGHWTPILIA